MKKRKLNSNNPKYKKKDKQPIVHKKLMKEIKGCKIYFIFENKDNNEDNL
jgi:hypothetical protein|tara:strand:+ start:17387 stop:17536 length:150 start_codon:yes stop_codon:yes gene_type:complete